MGLSDTLFAGLSGLDVSQAKLNVVANNIANANTVAFKSTRTLIKPQFYVTDSPGAQPDGDMGGTNPMQRGLGAVVASLERDFTPGAIESTGKPTDLAIDGEGFFIVRSTEVKYTRDGTFTLNPDNNLVTTTGDYVQGYAADENFKINTAQLSKLTIPLNKATTAQATTKAQLQGNLDANGDVASGATVYLTQDLLALGGGAAPTGASRLVNLASATDPATAIFTAGQQLTLSARKGSRDLPEATFTVSAGSTLNDLTAFFQQHLGVNTTVPDDANPATPAPGISLVAGSAANSTCLKITGNLGAENALSLPKKSFATIDGIAPFNFTEGTTSNPVGESVHTSFIAYDSLGTPVDVGLTMVLEQQTSTGNTWRFYVESPANSGGDLTVGTGTVTFDTMGRLRDSSDTTVAINRAGTGAINPLQITLDFSGMTSLTSSTSELAMSEQDGLPIGRLTAFSIGTDGQIIGSFSNGATRPLGQIAMATFSNRQGLIDRGSNMFVEGADSGPAVVGLPGTLGTGKIVSGSLELSNVDISEEFINLIIASTGFSASSRVISTSDQLLTGLLNSR